MARASRLTSLLFALLPVAACGAVGGGQPTVSRSEQVSYEGYSGTAIVSADGRTITVGGYPSACPAIITPVARESATQVALFLRSVTPPNPPSCPQAMASLVEARDVTLAEPLGDRRLVDGGDGLAIAWMSARFVLRPTAVPTGYRLTDFSLAANSGGASGPRPAAVVQMYGSPNSAALLVIRQVVGSDAGSSPGPGGWTAIRVRGYPGRATRNLIIWREKGLTDYILVGLHNGTDDPQLLSAQQLIAIADSAPPDSVGPLPTPAGRR